MTADETKACSSLRSSLACLPLLIGLLLLPIVLRAVHWTGS